MGALIGAVAGPILGGIIGSISGAGDRAAAQAAAQQALQQIQSVNAPPDLAQQIILNQFKQAGILTPQMEQNINQQFSNVANISEDPSLRNAQLSALSQLQKQGQTGLNASDMAALQSIRDQAATSAQGKAQQIQQQYQAMGQGGSGAQLAGELAAGQAGAQMQSNQGLQQAGLASQRALEALTASGQLGGQIRSQDFGVNQAKAQAQDALNRFNTQNALTIQQANTNQQNQAQAANLANAQNLSNLNAQAANQELSRQKAAQQQQYQDTLGLASAKANALNQQATNLNTIGNQTAQGWQNVGTGLGAGAGAIANYQALQGNQSQNGGNSNNSSNSDNSGYSFGSGVAQGVSNGAGFGSFYKGGEIVPGVYDFNSEIAHYYKGGQIVPGVYDFNSEIAHYSKGGKVSMQDRERLAREELAEKEAHSAEIARALLQHFNKGGQAKLGSGERFASLEHKLAHQKGVTDPKALAAAIGRNKYGAAKMNRLAHAAHGGTVGDLIDCKMCSGGMPMGHYSGGTIHHNQDNKPNGGYAMGGLADGGQVPQMPMNNAGNNSGEISHNGGGYNGGMWSAKDYRSGGQVPGKAPIKGDSPKNDIVKAMLSPGEIVLPRSVSQAPDAPDQAKDFVQITLMLKKKPKGSEKK